MNLIPVLRLQFSMPGPKEKKKKKKKKKKGVEVPTNHLNRLLHATDLDQMSHKVSSPFSD
jgi:LDH2 family malate/lactate/ureidoglycolate dehydrogenase